MRRRCRVADGDPLEHARQRWPQSPIEQAVGEQSEDEQDHRTPGTCRTSTPSLAGAPSASRARTEAPRRRGTGTAGRSGRRTGIPPTRTCSSCSAERLGGEPAQPPARLKERIAADDPEHVEAAQGIDAGDSALGGLPHPWPVDPVALLRAGQPLCRAPPALQASQPFGTTGDHGCLPSVPFHRGARLPRKASTPSFPSSLKKSHAIAWPARP